jgi:hypothetical protein
MPDPYAAFEVERTQDFNPDTGRTIVIIFAASESKLNEIAAYYEQAGSANPIGYGYKTTFRKAGGSIFLTVRIPDEILYTESWQFTTARERVPIWRDEKIRRYLKDTTGGSFGDLDLSTLANLQRWMRQIGYLNAAANIVGSGIGDPATVFTAASLVASKEDYDIIYLMVREGAFTDWKFPVLKRRRYLSSVNFAARTSMVGRDELYSLDGIADIFGIPADRYDQAVTAYDNLPTAALNTTWSWKLGRNDSEGVVGAAKDVECLEWTFGMWSTIKNDFIL